MTLLSNHNTKISTNVGSKVKTDPMTGTAPAGSKHATDSVASSGGGSTRAGMGSDRLPQGKLDTPKTL